jgi:hypothetical protein
MLRRFRSLLNSLRRSWPRKLREAPGRLSAPGFVCVDLHVLIRQAMYTYDSLFYLNADERRDTDPYWRNVYTRVALPLVRNMIDCQRRAHPLLFLGPRLEPADDEPYNTSLTQSGSSSIPDIRDAQRRHGPSSRGDGKLAV